MQAAPTPATCPRCNGSGWIPLPGDSLRVEPCGCQGDLRKQQRIAAAHIPKRYEHCTLDSFRDHSTTLRNAKKRVQQFIDEWPNAEKGLLLAGPCGSGKTHLAVATLNEIIRSGKPGRVMFANFSDLIQDIQSSFDSDHVPTKGELLEPLLDAELLVLDELGMRKPTDWVKDILYHLINSRYTSARTTIFTTNYYDQPAEAKEESLQNRIGVALRSRIYEMAYRVDFSGVEDYRPKKW
jgi:DNA replication protein DnaC